jgi:hypothetical protein
MLAAVKNLGQCIQVRSSKSPLWNAISVKIKFGRQVFVVNSFPFLNIMNVILGKAQAKFVPAAAVKRIVRVFDLMTRCIRPHRGFDFVFCKILEEISCDTIQTILLEYSRDSRYL